MDQADLFDFVTDVLERQNIRYAITGSHASMAYGENRHTNDIDIVIELTPQQLPTLLAEFPRDRFYISDDGANYATANGGQFNIIDTESIQKIDLIIPRDPAWPDRFVRRRRLPTDIGRDAWFVSPEDLILKKMDFYREGGSEKHIRDITAVMQALGDKLDRTYITEWSTRLDLSVIWRDLLSKLPS